MKNQTPDATDGIVQGLLDFLHKNDNDHLLSAVVDKLQQKVFENERTGRIISSIPLSTEQIKEVEQLLSNKLNQEVRLVNQVDRTILGGLIIRYKDLVIDQSVEGKLVRLSEELYETE